MEDNELYSEIHRKRAERQRRRQARIEREARRERVLAPIRLVAQAFIGAVVLYVWLFLAAL